MFTDFRTVYEQQFDFRVTRRISAEEEGGWDGQLGIDPCPDIDFSSTVMVLFGIFFKKMPFMPRRAKPTRWNRILKILELQIHGSPWIDVKRTYLVLGIFSVRLSNNAFALRPMIIPLTISPANCLWLIHIESNFSTSSKVTITRFDFLLHFENGANRRCWFSVWTYCRASSFTWTPCSWSAITFLVSISISFLPLSLEAFFEAIVHHKMPTIACQKVV